METFPSSVMVYWVMARGWWEYLWAVVSSGHSGGPGALSLANGTIHPGAFLGQGQCRGCCLLAKLSPRSLVPSSLAPVRDLHGMWRQWEHVGLVTQELKHEALLFLLSLALLEKKHHFPHSYRKC